MRKILICLAAISMVAMAGVAVGQGTKTMAMPSAHVAVVPDDIKWGSPPPVFEQNAGFTVISGDPSKAGLYVVRLKMPAGYKIMPHWHPTDEHVTVISGTFAAGMGDKFDEASMKAFPAGGYALMPAEMHHYAMAKTECIVQVHGMGPFALTYVNPADDPSKRAAASK
jgi:anti-sigma factor ChrR (cupin superfamily)